MMSSLIPAWAGKLTAHYQETVLLRRLQNLDLRRLLAAAAPMYIDDLLYVGEASTSKRSHRLPFRVSIKYFSRNNLSGLDRIDKRLTPNRSVYVVFCYSEIVHQSWVHFDAFTPSFYGFDSSVPVIESYTNRTFRGNGIFPYALNCILRDLKGRQLADRVYALVPPTNKAATRGLEKAGFQCLAHLKGTRYLGLFIAKKSIDRAPEALVLEDRKASELLIAS
jgi:RimJ/RimL family protein N-acetyltransferase